MPWNDFGSGDVPMDQKYVDLWASRGKSMVRAQRSRRRYENVEPTSRLLRCGTERRPARTQVQIPIMIGPVGVFFNLPGVTSINMNACTLTKVFTGAINRWNDPVIQAQNPGVALPSQQILVFTRKSGSSSTFGAPPPPRHDPHLPRLPCSCAPSLTRRRRRWRPRHRPHHLPEARKRREERWRRLVPVDAERRHDELELHLCKRSVDSAGGGVFHCEGRLRPDVRRPARNALRHRVHRGWAWERARALGCVWAALQGEHCRCCQRLIVPPDWESV